MQRFAFRAFIKVGVWTSIAYTGVDAACKFHGLEVGEGLNTGSCLGKTLHASVGKNMGHFIKSGGSQVISDFHREWTQDI